MNYILTACGKVQTPARKFRNQFERHSESRYMYIKAQNLYIFSNKKLIMNKNREKRKKSQNIFLLFLVKSPHSALILHLLKPCTLLLQLHYILCHLLSVCWPLDSHNMSPHSAFSLNVLSASG